MNRLICLIALSFFGLAGASNWSTCCSSCQVTRVVVSDCPDSVVTCPLPRGTQPTVAIEFTSGSASETVRAVVTGVIGGVPMPFPVPGSKYDGCKSGIKCPMNSGRTYTYTNALEVRKSYPALGVTIRWELKDDNGANIVCVEIPCKMT